MMKLVLTTIVLMASASAFASNELDGKAFCRTVVSGGMFGQPKGERQHCIRFENGIATDSANTFFGNPPESSKYRVRGSQVSFGKSQYVLSADRQTLTTVKGSTVQGTVLTVR